MNKIEKKIEKYNKLEKEILDEISKLSDYGGECHCMNHSYFYVIHYGNLFNEIIAYCIKCGGMMV